MKAASKGRFLLKRVFSLIIPEFIRVFVYPVFRGRSVVNPLHKRTLNALINNSKLYERFSEVSLTQDKLLAKLWVERHAPWVKTPTVYRVARTFSGLDLESFEGSGFIKTNHSCGYNYFFNKGAKVPPDVVESFDLALTQKFNEAAVEWSYKYVRPRIYIEEVVESDLPDIELRDYKVFVVFGKAKMIQVDCDRFTNHRRSLFDVEWNELNVEFEYPSYDLKIERPERLTEMLEAAERIAMPFQFCRVDFYIAKDEIVFGEVSHYPEGGYGRFSPKCFEKEIIDATEEGRLFLDRYYV
ncbi:ATP-grasp fold amidoligase family protein [Aquisalimonas sp. APHAB1-3]|uniref:ATP-grasp fold amidoligase family protein n=1 Tax=Aquisalimonas sp. APHAB1-3 TaxID=3402080 RepID=UPI003AAA7BCC